MKRAIHLAIAVEFIALGASLSAGHAPTWLLIGLVGLSCAGVLLALYGIARQH